VEPRRPIPPRLRAPAGALLALALVLGGGCGSESAAGGSGSLARPADDDWAGPELAAFTMVERSGRQVSLADLAGRTLVLDFIFTTCAGPCPVMSAGMQDLQAALEGTEVLLVSVTVDPETDTLEVLREYAGRYEADPERWLFLRGDSEAVGELAASVSLALQRDSGADVGFQVSHSTRLVVVDGAGRVRGYYDGTTRAGREQAAARARWLESR
jgi:cytochrome oxidase Cu insertion factor (SCO1/SenC/PrrC family)